MFAIGEMRRRAGMDQRQAAEACGMPLRRYGSYEREECNISLESACVIAKAFGCTLDELAGITPSGVMSQTEDMILQAYRNAGTLDKAIMERIASTLASSPVPETG